MKKYFLIIFLKKKLKYHLYKSQDYLLVILYSLNHLNYHQNYLFQNIFKDKMKGLAQYLQSFQENIDINLLFFITFSF